MPIFARTEKENIDLESTRGGKSVLMSNYFLAPKLNGFAIAPFSEASSAGALSR
jgi:hypothetical protein